MSIVAYIGLGSNLGDSKVILTEAVHKLASLGDVKISKLYQSPPMGPQDQPNYLNAVVQLSTNLAPLALLDELQRFEQESGRVRLRHWGKRTLDLDLLILRCYTKILTMQSTDFVSIFISIRILISQSITPTIPKILASAKLFTHYDIERSLL